MTKQTSDVHALSIRIPEPLYKAVASISDITGESLNQLAIKGYEAVVADFNTRSATVTSATASTTGNATVSSVTFEVPQLGMVRQAYASSPRWSQEPHRRPAVLSKWTSTSEEKTDE